MAGIDRARRAGIGQPGAVLGAGCRATEEDRSALRGRRSRRDHRDHCEEDLGYAGIAVPQYQNGVHGCRRAIVYALFLYVARWTGPSSSLAAVAGGAVLTAGAKARGHRAGGGRRW